MKIALAADHAGFDYKEEVKRFLIDQGITVEDLGTNTSEAVDYPVFARDAAQLLIDQKVQFGILICGSGQGMAIVANKMRGIRAALCFSEELAKTSRTHNNANILVLGARFTALAEAKKIVSAFINTEFESGGRHERRVNQIHDLTGI